MNAVNLIYLSPWRVGGSTTYTIHLYEALKMNGINVEIFSIGNRTEGFTRPLGKYGIEYTNLSKKDLIGAVRRCPSLLTAPAPAKNLPDNLMRDLMKAGMRVTVHDPNEFEVYDHLKLVKNPIIIRNTMKKYYKDAVFIPHPYVRRYENSDGLNSGSPVSISRISSVKNSKMIFATNEELKSRHIVMYGAENRLYTYGAEKKYPDFRKYIRRLPLERYASVDVCRKARLAIDLTVFKNDGGGSQYSFMEAMDAGAVNILHRDWTSVSGEMVENENCLSIGSSDELSLYIRQAYAKSGSNLSLRLNNIKNAGYKTLSKHSPKKIAKAYIEELYNG